MLFLEEGGSPEHRLCHIREDITVWKNLKRHRQFGILGIVIASTATWKHSGRDLSSMFVWLCRYNRIDCACEFCLNVFIKTSRLDDTSGEEMKEKQYYHIWYFHCIIRGQS